MKRMIMNALRMACINHQAVGLWRYPGNHGFEYKDLDYWTQTARDLEAACFDALFLADTLGLYDSYGSTSLGLRHAIHTPQSDPLMMISAMAAVTKHLGFAVTVTTSYEHPYLLARKLTTLDHLTKGRLGWNVVTSNSDSAARNLGLVQQMRHEERYKRAEEFLEVVYKLWQGSWEDGAIINNVAANTCIEPRMIHPIAHNGENYRVPDPFMCEPSIQRTPVIFQAGASADGKRFAARHAEGIFVVETEAKELRKQTDEVRGMIADAGRDPQSVKFFAGATMVVGDTDVDAQRRYENIREYLSEEGMLARFSTLIQKDLSSFDLDKPLELFETQGVRSVLERYASGKDEEKLTIRQIAKKLASSPGGVCFVGSVENVADQMEQWMEDTDVDGFNIYDILPLQYIPVLGQSLIPELQKRGRIRTSYDDGSTLRERLYGAGQQRPRSDHPAAKYEFKLAQAAE
ncbi:LLM class flavin-dependent oxidoreductase [Aminobacter sp. MSH1]|uniref:LLM class flavin-dependent oxidoreductase n=1 Tax=Aminobacter sp. MSH1 TaxID=374606 RepID=UPI000D378575|nr:LLM class flavin-dependent oxidoreductase [Aminobacter sp. MSH1]